MKKKLTVLLALVMVFSLTACGGNNEKELKEDVKTEEKTETKDNKEKSNVLATIDDFKIDVVVEEPDSLGSVYAKMTLTNNTEYPLLSYEVTALRKDNNEKTYFATYDTVMPGETSPNFETMVAENNNPGDYEIIAYEYSLKSGDKKIVINYDVKLDKYTTFEIQE